MTLAVGNIIGGNSFDKIFPVSSEVAFRPGSIYIAINQEQIWQSQAKASAQAWKAV